MATEVVETDEVRPAVQATWTLYSVVNFVVGVVELFLVARFVLKMLAANAATPFVHWIYQISQPLVAPFAGIFPTSVQGASALEWSVLIAMVAYAILSYLVIWVIGIITP